MKSLKIKSLLSIVMNILTAILVAAAVGCFFVGEGLASGIGNMKAGGISCFMFFTVDSNILVAVCGLVIIPYSIKSFKNGKNEIPKPAVVLKFIGTTAVTVTFLVVLFFLGPIMGYSMMFEKNCFLLHLICPLFSVFTFCFCENESRLSIKQALFCVLPTLIYGAVYLVNVIFTETWDDFYHFNIGGFWYITYVVMLFVTYIIALVLEVIHNKTGVKK